MRASLIIFIFSCSQFVLGQHVDRDVFENTLGKEKAYAYNFLEKSFEDFLLSNYQNKNSLAERIKSYLTDVRNQYLNWTFNDSLSNATPNLLERTGLRKDILLYKSEKYKERFDFENYLKKDSSNVKIEFVENYDDFEDIETPEPDGKDKKRIKNERQKIMAKLAQPNKNGRFYYALAKAQTNHQDINAYLSDSELLKWENQLIVIVEVYLNSLLNWKL